MIGLLFILSDHRLNFFFLSLLPLGLAMLGWLRGAANGRIVVPALAMHAFFVFCDESNWLDGLMGNDTNLVILSLFFHLDYVGFAGFAMVMVLASARGILAQHQALHETQLRSSSLENQLLRKHIQPHFLLNSLMSLQHLIKTEPETAMAMVDALSEEFQLLRTMDRRKWIKLKEELDACRTHLKIMSMQQRAGYELVVEGINGEECIPPGVVHTLVENGLTHGYAGRQNGYFHFSKTVKEQRIRYRLFNDSQPREEKEKQPSSHTGLAYVRARLEECFPGKWQLSSRAVSNGWEVLFEIPDHPPKGEGH